MHNHFGVQSVRELGWEDGQRLPRSEQTRLITTLRSGEEKGNMNRGTHRLFKPPRLPPPLATVRLCPGGLPLLLPPRPRRPQLRPPRRPPRAHPRALWP